MKALGMCPLNIDGIWQKWWHWHWCGGRYSVVRRLHHQQGPSVWVEALPVWAAAWGGLVRTCSSAAMAGIVPHSAMDSGIQYVQRNRC